MTGEREKAKEVFQSTVREAALRSAHGEPPANRLWFFGDARWRCLGAAEGGLEAEHGHLEDHEVAAHAPTQIAEIDVDRLATWISSAPEPQRTALSLYYLDEFSHRELLTILGLNERELGTLLTNGRRQFQAWLNAHAPHYEDE